MYEPRTKPLLSRPLFYARVVRSFRLASLILAVALGIGMVGYHGLEHLAWLDSFVNASMILSGMGPATPVETSAGKLFAGVYALFSGLIFMTCTGVAFAPIFHRFLHKFPEPQSKK